LLPDEAHFGQADVFGDHGAIGVEPVASVEGLGPWIVLCDPQEGGLLSDHSVYQRLPGPASVMVGVQVQVVQLQWTGRIALAIGACRVINVKPGQVGGYLQAKRILDLAGRTRSPWGDAGDRVGPSCESALAGLAGFRLSGEISASDRFYTTDITKPFILNTDTSACLRARLGSPRSSGSADSGLHPTGCSCPMEGRCMTMALL